MIWVIHQLCLVVTLGDADEEHCNSTEPTTPDTSHATTAMSGFHVKTPTPWPPCQSLFTSWPPKSSHVMAPMPEPLHVMVAMPEPPEEIISAQRGRAHVDSGLRSNAPKSSGSKSVGPGNYPSVHGAACDGNCHHVCLG
ncbi:hypothetical protein DPX16_15463 [Anabarilius grahami]|uniref:Secreted protein n=1 Tax=Anabarilius grahami TaxID=495550 RepID=A0A3N0XWQ2_ANAGA|nr:hypothetical protein DPX16_15463 [Anabarilius grahami]